MSPWQGKGEFQAGKGSCAAPGSAGVTAPARRRMAGGAPPCKKTLTRIAVFLSLGEKCIFNALFPDALHNNL